MKSKLYKFPIGAHFLFNGVEFIRHEYVESINCYRCSAVNRKLVIFLDPKVNVNHLQSFNNDTSC